jgi:uncharacterized protein (DUF39 family)
MERKTYEEINDRIRKGRAVVVTAEQMSDIVDEHGAAGAARRVDVVTCGTFGPMCSSGALLNVGHAAPRIKITRATLNGVPACAGLAAVDLYVGATALREDEAGGGRLPTRSSYGGAHVIEDLVRGRDVLLRAEGQGTDCYPRHSLETLINIADLNDAILWNPRNAYQNYNVAVNATGRRTIRTYLGPLRPGLANAGYSSAGQLSPLLNDPGYRTLGPGTRIFLGGAAGFVCGAGTQHDPSVPRGRNGVPTGGAGTLMVTGDLKAMSADWLRAVSIAGYGVSLAVGLGVPIPILDEDLARSTAVRDRDILAPVIDYAGDYPLCTGGPLCHVTYEQLRSGWIEVAGRRVKTAALSSYPQARRIARELGRRIEAGRFLLSAPAEPLPGPDSGRRTGPLVERPPSIGGGR